MLYRSVEAAPVAPLFAPRGQATHPAKTKRRRLRPPRSTRRAAARRAAAAAAPDPSAPSQTLLAALPAWSALGASPWFLRTIRFGLFIPWAHPPTPERQAAYDLSASDLVFSRATADAWCASGTVSEVPPAVAAALKHLAPSFVVNKGKDRLVVDLSSRNAHVADRPFRYETLPGLVTQLDAGDHLVLWDITDAFHHIRLQAADRLRLAFRIGARVFLPNVLPFGLKMAPWAFTKLMLPVVTVLRRLGFRLISFSDDFGGAPPGSRPCSKTDATAGRRTALALFASLGVQVHAAKGVAIGTQALPLLGFLVHTVRRLILFPPGRLSSLLVAARRLSSAACFSSRWVRRKTLQRFCGLAASCSLAIPAARLRLHHLYVAQRGRRGWCHLRHGALAELAWWRRLRRSREVGCSLWLPHLGALRTDASPYGLGGHDQNLVPARGFFSLGVQRMHINVKEVEADTLSLMSLCHLWDPGGGVVDLWIDNKVAKYVISNMSTRSRALHWALCRLRRVLVCRGLCLRGSWLSSAANFRADYLSRVTDRTDWRLSPAVCADLDARWGPHTVYRFASDTNAQVPRFKSLWLCPGTEAVDALRQW